MRVHFQVIEGQRRRVQVFEGIVIKRQGSGVARDVHRAQAVVRRRRRADVPGALAEDREDRGGCDRRRQAREALLPARKVGKKARVRELRPAPGAKAQQAAEDAAAAAEAEAAALEAAEAASTRSPLRSRRLAVEEASVEMPRRKRLVEDEPAEEEPADEPPRSRGRRGLRGGSGRRRGDRPRPSRSSRAHARQRAAVARRASCPLVLAGCGEDAQQQAAREATQTHLAAVGRRRSSTTSRTRIARTAHGRSSASRRLGLRLCRAPDRRRLRLVSRGGEGRRRAESG